MWPRARAQLLQQNQRPSGYSMGFNQYPQNHQQGSFRGAPLQHSQHFNNRQRRDRARPSSQYSFYSDESAHSNYSSNTLNWRGGTTGIGRGSGLINAGTRNAPTPRPQFNNKRQNERDRVNNNMQRNVDNPDIPDRSNRNRYEHDRNYNQSKENRYENKMKPDHHEDMIQPAMYFCPKCGENYNSRHTQYRYAGKIPLILQCSHTMCQECIYQGLKNNKVNCPTCLTDSTLTQEQTPVCQSDMQNVFLPNFYILGIISYYKVPGGHLRNLENMTFVSTTPKKSHPILPNTSDSCCFPTCSKEATMFCPSCEGIYCSDCCTVVHKSTKKLMSHEPIPTRKSKFSLLLENCGEHPTMQVEFFCKVCDLTACCYCTLEKHHDHVRIPLYHLESHEMEEFKRQKKVAERALKEVLYTQKKTTKLANFDTMSVKKEVCQYFADCHGELESLEKKLCEELESFKANNRGLDSIQTSLMTSAEQLKRLVSFDEDKIGDKKLNLRGALEKLRNIDDIPRFLLNEDGQAEPVRFVTNNATRQNWKEDFTIEKCEDLEYRLVTEKELPKSYVMDFDESDNEVDEALSAIIHGSNQSSELMSFEPKTADLPIMVPVSAASSLKSKKPQKNMPREQSKKKPDMEKVDVQHINAMDSFFVQYKTDQSKLSLLNRDIDTVVKMGGAEAVPEPQLNDLYLMLYVNESHNQKEQRWCRARLTEIKTGKNGPLYEMFLIDYGKTQVVDGNRVKNIPPVLAKQKPFAIECMLHNPMDVNWNKKAHFSLAKILIGKQVYMMEKSYNQGIYEVDLMIASSDGGVTSVTDILVHAHSSVDPINDDSVSLDGSLSARKDGYYPMLKIFPNSKTFSKSQKEKVIIATVVDPQNIFVHLVQHQETFKAMIHAIKKAYKTAKSNGCIPIEGTYVLVEYKDAVRANWHRAFIKSVDLNSDKVHVLLVDWGFNVVVSTRNIRALQECFTRLESQAVLVKLAHVAPYNKQAMWSPQAANFLQAFHKSQDVLKMVVHEADTELEVALFDISGNVDVCLNAMMVENNLADSTGPISTKLHWPQFTATNPVFSEEDGLMSLLLKKVDEQADDDSEEEDVSNVKKKQLDVVKVVAPDLIWIKFLEFRERESSMFKELQIHYSQEQVTKDTWYIGEPCVVEVGQEFTRGKILEIVGDHYTVYLVDKVKEITASIEKIYDYANYFAKYPQAVVKSHLANIRPAGDTGKWSISSIEALQQIFSKHKRIYANKALESDLELSKKSLPLDMWYGLVIRGGPLDPDRMKYVSINNSLVKLGYAYKIPRPMTPKPSASAEADVSSPVKKAATGEDLLKSLINITDTQERQSAKDILPLGSTDDDRSEPVHVVSKTEAAIGKSPKKNKSGKKNILKRTEDIPLALEFLLETEPESHAHGAIKKCKKPRKLSKTAVDELPKEKDNEDQKVVELVEDLEMTETAKERLDKSNERSNRVTKRNDDFDEYPIQNWNTIVEQELGGVAAETKQKNLDDINASVSAESENSPYHKSEVAIDDWLPPFRLTKKDFRARVTCAETGGHLYLHEEAMNEVYYTMEANIKEYFDGNPPETTNHQWEPGHLCTIKFTDGNWYRGKILKIKSPAEISVFMIDFGSDHDLSPAVLFREILYTDIGSFATKVKLDKVYARSGSWLTSDYNHFHELVTNWCRIVVKGPIDIEQPLVEVYNENGVFVNQKLIELCPNLSRCSNFPTQEVEEEDAVIEDEQPYADEVMKILMDSFNKELDIKTTASKETFQPGSNKEVLKYEIMTLPLELIEGKKVIMEIGGIMNFDRVALRMPGQVVSEEMYDLGSEIQEDVESLPKLNEFSVGMPCLAPYSEDGLWYRARVTSTNTVDLGLVDVIFIDYGNSEAVSTKNVKAISPKLLNLPQQSWEASLNVALKEDADVITVMPLMSSLDRKRKHVKLVKEVPLTVDIYDRNEKLCYEALIRSGTLKPLQEGENSQ